MAEVKVALTESTHWVVKWSHNADVVNVTRTNKTVSTLTLEIELASCHPSVIVACWHEEWSDWLWHCRTAWLNTTIIMSYFYAWACECKLSVLSAGKMHTHTNKHTHRITVSLPVWWCTVTEQHKTHKKLPFSLNRKTSHLTENLSLKRWLKPSFLSVTFLSFTSLCATCHCV